MDINKIIKSFEKIQNNLNAIDKNTFLLEEKFCKFESITGFDIDDFINLYMAGVIEFKSEIDIELIRKTIKDVGPEHIINIYTENQIKRENDKK